MTNRASTKPNTPSELKLHRIYTKSSLFEAANQAFTELVARQPIIDLQVNANVYPQSFPENTHEVVLTLQITAKHNGALLWRIQLQKAGCYTLTGLTPETAKSVLNGFCMNQLYPYACAEASHLANQGGFEMLYLHPIDFVQQYKEQQSAVALETAATSINQKGSF